MRISIFIRGLACLGIGICLAACGRQFDIEAPTDGGFSEEENLMVVGVSQVGSESVWRTANSNSIQTSFTKENGYMLIFKNARQKQENQIKAIRSFISQQVDYIVFSPITEYGWDTVLQEAKDADIPVILMDRMLQTEDQSLYAAWVGSDFEAEGESAGRWLEDYLEKKGRTQEDIHIVVLQGTRGATSAIGRTKGFEKIVEQHANWKILEQTDADYTTAKGREIMSRMLETHERIDVVVSQNDDMTFGALDAIRQKGLSTGEDGDLIIISFDAVKAALEMVQDGIIQVDIECNPEQGEAIRQIIESLERGEPVGKIYYIEEKVFTADNVGDYIEDRNY